MRYESSFGSFSFSWSAFLLTSFISLSQNRGERFWNYKERKFQEEVSRWAGRRSWPPPTLPLLKLSSLLTHLLPRLSLWKTGGWRRWEKLKVNQEIVWRSITRRRVSSWRKVRWREGGALHCRHPPPLSAFLSNSVTCSYTWVFPCPVPILHNCSNPACCATIFLFYHLLVQRSLWRHHYSSFLFVVG